MKPEYKTRTGRGAVLALVVLAICATDAQGASRKHGASATIEVIEKRFWNAYSAGKYDAALVEAQKLAAALRSRSGASSVKYAGVLNRVANAYYAQSRYGEAEPLYRQVVAIVENAKGRESPELAVYLDNLGNLYKAQRRYDEALGIYQRELAIQEKSFGADSIQAAAALNRVANVLNDQRQHDKADELYRRVVAIVEKAKGRDSPDLAVYLDNLANNLDDLARYAEAIEVYARELAIKEKASGRDSADVAGVLTDLARENWLADRYDEAEKLHKRALAIREKIFGPDSPAAAISLNHLGNVYSSQRRFSEAEPYYQRALAINENNSGANSPLVAMNLNNLGNVYSAQDRIAEAIEVFKRSLAIREQSPEPDNVNIGSALKNLGDTYYKQGNYGQAEDCFKRSLELRERTLGADHPDVAQSLVGLALLYDLQGKYADAEKLLLRAVEIYEKRLGPQNLAVAGALDYLATVYYRQAKYDASESLYKRSIAIRERIVGPDHPDLAVAVIWLGILYQKRGDYARAEPLFKRAVELKERALGPDHNDVGTTLLGLGNIYYSEGKLNDAEKAYSRALAIKERVLGPKHADVSQIIHSLANIYGAQGKLDQAEQFYRRALAIHEGVVSLEHPHAAITFVALANTYKKEKKYAEAEDAYKRALAIQDKVLGRQNQDGAATLAGLMDLYTIQGRFDDALPLVRRAIADKQAQTWAAFPVLFEAATTKRIDWSEAIEDSLNIVQIAMQTSAGQALNALAVRFSAGDGRLATLVRQDQDLAAEAGRLDKELTDTIARPLAKRDAAAEQKLRDRIAAIGKDRGNIEEVFAREFADYAALSKPQSLTLDELQALMSDDEALLVVNLAWPSYVWAVTKADARWVRLSINAAQAGQTIAALRSRLDPFSRRPFDANLSFQLYRQIIGLVEDLITGKPRLTFVVNGALTSLPPQLLVTRDPAGKALKDVDWLARTHAVTVLPSIASLKVLRGKSAAVGADKPLIGFADPVFSRAAQSFAQNPHAVASVTAAGGFDRIVADAAEFRTALPRLPDTANELREVAASVRADPADVILGADATESRVKSEKLERYRIVYFATHGLLAGEVSDFFKLDAEPALVLSLPENPTDFDDGLLTASEVAQLKLDADWVVLSACNTAAGEKPGAEALSGLARAFFYAGGRSLLVSNWEVETKSAVALMTGTFAALTADPRLSHGEALQKSMLAMIDDRQHPEWADPKYWAPFVVVGEPAKPQ
jgi:tetratricopeptide (TPR) repeat protein/CHAT domain-containing protein